jgi:RNA polymerase sigma factor (TIGR02999 family)
MYGQQSVIQACHNPGEVTNLLRDWRSGDPSALERLTPIIYDDLLRLARARLKGERKECTLQPTALVHESYLRLADQTRLDVGSRAHFYSIAANVMRRVLIDYARKRNAQKRNGGLRITLKTGMDFAEAPALDSVLLDDALRKLTAFDERKSQAITLKFFGGMTTEEIATALGISVATVGRELRLGQAWLRRELSIALV